jgi:hypothetical protein
LEKYILSKLATLAESSSGEWRCAGYKVIKYHAILPSLLTLKYHGGSRHYQLVPKRMRWLTNNRGRLIEKLQT